MPKSFNLFFYLSVLDIRVFLSCSMLVLSILPTSSIWSLVNLYVYFCAVFNWFGTWTGESKDLWLWSHTPGMNSCNRRKCKLHCQERGCQQAQSWHSLSYWDLVVALQQQHSLVHLLDLFTREKNLPLCWIQYVAQKGDLLGWNQARFF